MYEDLHIGIILTLLLGAIIAIIMSLVYVTERVSCHKKYVNFEPEFTFWGGCQIMQNGVLTPVEMVRIMD